jgi:hypothetical protein
LDFDGMIHKAKVPPRQRGFIAATRFHCRAGSGRAIGTRMALSIASTASQAR